MSRKYDGDIIICVAATVVTILAGRKKKTSATAPASPYFIMKKGKDPSSPGPTTSKGVSKENSHMGIDMFQDIFNLVELELLAEPTDGMTPQEKFTCVIEFLQCGYTQSSKPLLGAILDEVCLAICNVLKDEISNPTSTEFVTIANEFNNQWNLPNCLGAIGSKHIPIKGSPSEKTPFFNDKGYFSVELMAVADANYKFLCLDIGAYGSVENTKLFAATPIGKEILQNKLPLPDDSVVGGRKLPYFFVANGAYPLYKRIMTPYIPSKPQELTDGERITNYRIGKARRCVENALGILSSRWLCMTKTMFSTPERATIVTRTCCLLHNYLLKRNRQTYCPPRYTDHYDETGCLVEGEWRKHISKNALLQPTFELISARYNSDAENVRNRLKEYLVSPSGSIPWQNKAAFCQ